MRLGGFFTFIFIFLIISLLLVWAFIPYKTNQFIVVSGGESNFSLNPNENESMQFYKNMRFPDSKISYRISKECSLQKQNEMEEAFQIIGDKTILYFYPMSNNEEVLVNCEDKIIVEGDLFIAGEGGPTNVTQGQNFNVILRGEILLLKQSSCSEPNVEIHELLHVLGFDHSENPNNIMYPISNCGQSIGEDTINLINKLYSISKNPDLLFIEVSAVMHGRYLDVNMTIKNDGLENSQNATIKIYADNKIIKEFDLDKLNIGYGRVISLKNIGTTKVSIDKLKFTIDYPFEEINKDNNFIELKIK